MPASHHAAYYDLVERLERPGCPVCALAARSVSQYLDTLAYEQVNEPAVRAALRHAGGFCRRHAWQFLQMGGAVLGAAIIYADLLRTVRRELSADTRTDQRGRSPRRLLRGLLGGAVPTNRERARTCPACAVEEQAEHRYLSIIQEVAGDAAFQERYATADGLCLPHLRAALQGADGATADLLLKLTGQKLEGLLHDLAEFIRKHDYRFRHEGWVGREAESPTRAVRFVAGEPFCRSVDSGPAPREAGS